MIRHAAAVIVVLCLSPLSLRAQGTEFTVNTASANVHKSPSTGSPIIGRATRGAVLSVTRELGSWVRIVWAGAQDGVGYVHVSTGWIARITAPGSRPAASPARASMTSSPFPPAIGTPSLTAGRAQPERTAAGAQAPTIAPDTLAPAAHSVGLGGRMGGATLGFGASARAAIAQRFAAQIDVSRYTSASAAASPRLTSVQFAPSLLYSLPDKLTDYVWVRPYVGGGITIYRSTLGSGVPGANDAVADSRLGRQAFGGAEVIFAAVPRFTVSGDYGYRWPQTPFDGFELGGRGLSFSGHWYVK